MAGNDTWPEALARYIQSDGSLLLRPQGLIPGQLPILAIFSVLGCAAIVGIIASAEERLACTGLLVASLLVLALPISQLLRWTRIARRPEGWCIKNGTWRHHRSSVVVPFVEIQTALIVKDEKGYRLEFPVFEHVRIALAAKPFNDPPASLEVGELFRLRRPELESLAQVLAPGAAVIARN